MGSLAGVQAEASSAACSGALCSIFELDPVLLRAVRSASVSIVGPAGRTAFAWTFLPAGGFRINASVPPGQEAELRLPPSFSLEGEGAAGVLSRGSSSVQDTRGRVIC